MTGFIVPILTPYAKFWICTECPQIIYNLTALQWRIQDFPYRVCQPRRGMPCPDRPTLSKQKTWHLLGGGGPGALPVATINITSIVEPLFSDTPTFPKAKLVKGRVSLKVSLKTSIVIFSNLRL